MQKSNKKERILFNIEAQVSQELKRLIKPRERSIFANKVLEKALKKKAVESLNERIRGLEPVDPVELPIESLRKLRESGVDRIERLANMTKKSNVDE